MSKNLYKLLSTYEYSHAYNNVEVPIRIEVLKSVDKDGIYRARVWALNTYNLYPSQVNTGDTGEDLQQMHSADQVNQDITTLIADDVEILTGKSFKNEGEVLRYIQNKLTSYL